MAEAKMVKRRGRPVASSSEYSAALDARRQRNREAQNVFRKRRQAAEAAQTKRLRRLEEVVEEMSSIFMTFVDEMLACDDFVAQQPGLVVTLRRSMKRILSLAHEVVGPEDSENPLMSSTSSPVISTSASASASAASVAIVKPVPEQLSPLGHSSTSPPGAGSISSLASEDTMECNLNLGSDAAHRACHTARTLALPAPPDVTENLPEPETTPIEDEAMFDSVMPVQVYGNGWTVSNNPILGGDSPRYWGPRIPLSRDSFAFRLAKASLTIAYLILSGSDHPPVPLSEEQRIFGSNLCYRGRDDLLIRLRWLLGPGSDYMYRVVDLPYGQHGAQVFSKSDLNPSCEDLGLPSLYTQHSPDSSTRYLSILGVEKQLLALGARIIDTETLELNIASPASSPSPSPDVVATQPDSWSFINFYSPDQLRPKADALTMELSINLLVSNLARSGVCLMRGPGYPRDELGGAIQSSVIKVI